MSQEKYQAMLGKWDKIKEKVTEAIADVEARLDDEGLSVDYDSDTDYLYVTIGAARPGMSVPFSCIAAIVDPETYELLAIEIPFFVEAVEAKRFPEQLGNLFRQWITAGKYHVYIPSKQDRKKVGADFKELVPA